ncbi:MAG TPA: hypothetical protein VHH90_03145, partial [Polyangia bacterium]|nr:hypothetical protein [Polyangia bacterium]
MRALGLMATALALLVANAPVARAQAPAPAPPGATAPAEPVLGPGERIAVGQAPVVGGNAAGARERALDEAIRQAVDQALSDLVDAPTRTAQAK